MPMLLQAPEFDDGGLIPSRYTCDGENVSPELQWLFPPKGTKSFALIVSDPDAPRKWRLCVALSLVFRLRGGVCVDGVAASVF